MRKELILILVSLLAAGLLIAQCGGSSSVDLPDLAGTWEGTAWVETEVFKFDQMAESLSDQAQLLEPVACPSVDGFVDIELTTDAEGNPTGLLMCGQSIESILGTGITGEVDEEDIDNNVLWVTFSESSSGEELFYGGLFIDDSLDYVFFILWDDIDDIVYASLQNYPASMPNYSESALAGVWSGFAVDIDDFEWTWDKASPVDVTLEVDESLSVDGTDPDGFTITGSIEVPDSNYGYAYGTLDVMETKIYLDGVQSPDGEFFGAVLWEPEGSDDWSVIMMRRQASE